MKNTSSRFEPVDGYLRLRGGSEKNIDFLGEFVYMGFVW